MSNGDATTSVTLLARLRSPADEQAWREFDARYRELIVWFLRRRGLQIADVEDVTQQVIAKLVAGLRSFEYDREKAGFRTYLYRCVRNALFDFRSRQNSPAGAVGRKEIAVEEVQAGDDGFAAFEREWADHHYRRAVRRFRDESDARGNEILDATIAGHAPRLVAERLGITEAAVYKAQQRLRDRLRELIAAQLRDEEIDRERKPE